MAGTFCSFCGRRLPAGAAFCPSCGAAVPGAPAVPPAAGTTGARVPPLVSSAVPSSAPAFAVPGSAVPEVRGAPDRTALSQVEIAAILTLVGVIFELVVSAVTNFARIASASSGSGGVVLSLPPVGLVIGVIAVSAAVEVTGLYFYRSAFVALAPVDRRFSSPGALALVAIIGLVLAVIGVWLFLIALYDAVRCAGSGNPVTQACLFTGTFWASLALLAVGAIVAVVGYIGVLLGIWRLGTRYRQTVFKVGAILLIFPYLNLVGAILIWAGARGARREAEPYAFPSQTQ